MTRSPQRGGELLTGVEGGEVGSGGGGVCCFALGIIEVWDELSAFRGCDRNVYSHRGSSVSVVPGVDALSCVHRRCRVYPYTRTVHFWKALGKDLCILLSRL